MERAFSLAGKGVGGARFIPFQAHPAQGLTNALPDLPGRQRQVTRTEGHIFLHGHAHDLVVRVLENHAHGPADPALQGGVPGIETIHGHSPLRRNEQGVQMLQERALPAAVVPGQGDVLSLAEAEVYPPEDIRPVLPVAKRNPIENDHCLPGPFTSFRRSRIFTQIRAATIIFTTSPGSGGRTPTIRALRRPSFATYIS